MDVVIIALIVLLGLAVWGTITTRTRRNAALPHQADPKARALDADPLSPREERKLLDTVERELRKGRKIEAIRVYRAATGAGLKEAKNAVEAIERGDLGFDTASTHGYLGEAEQALRRGHKIEAIKAYRAATGAGLKEAKDAVEAMEREGRF